MHAAHECDAIEEIYVAGKALGTLDVNGYVTSGDYVSYKTESVTQMTTGTSISLSYTPSNVMSVFRHSDITIDEMWGDVSVPYSMVGNVISFDNPGGRDIFATYLHVVATPRIRVRKHLGSSTDAADDDLSIAVPSKWNSTNVLRGFCYTYIRLDLNQPEFQSGVPQVQVLLRGKKLYDPRTGLTAWSQNNALAIRDYLLSEICGVDAVDIDDAQFITAANVCDEVQTFGPRYLFNGVVLSSESQAGVLGKMAESMAGGIVSTTWDIWAGKYVAPVLALTQDDIVGDVSITPGVSDGVLYNGVRGQFVSSENTYVATDFTPFQNSTYLASDGRDLWTNIDFPFTDALQRVHNLARIYVEDQRNGFTLKAEFSLKAWSLKIGQRVTFTSALFGQTAKVYRVTDKSYSPTSAVELTLKEDAASIWDFADAVTADETPNTNLPNPYAISPLAYLTCSSGEDVLLIQQDGTIVSRILVTWPQATTQAVFTNGEIEIEWAKASGSNWHKISTSGDSVLAYLSPVEDLSYYLVRARAVNPYLNVKSDWTYAATHQVIGKTEVPPDVAALFVTNGVFSWSGVSRTEVKDLAGYKFRFHYGQNNALSNAEPLHSGLVTTSPWTPSLMPSGAVTVMITAVDTSGNESAHPAVVYANFGDPIVENLILSYDDKAVGFPGVKTDCSVVASDLLADDSGGLFWGPDNAPFWGFDTAPFWPVASYKQAIYLTSYTVQADESGSRMTLLADITASSYALEYRYDTQGPFWGNDVNFFWGEDDDFFWAQPTEWRTWPGAIDDVSGGKVEFRIITQAGIVQGAISTFTLQFDVEDESEILEDVAILAGGTRLVLSKTYRSIKFVSWTLQDDGGVAVRVNVADKSAILGPQVYSIDATGANVTGVSDFEIQGVKG